MDKNQIAETLNNIGILLELKGDNPFKVRAYMNASQIIQSTSEEIDELIQKNNLTSIKGIGKSIADVITELVRTGTSKQYEELRSHFPSELLELLKIQGLGPKRLKLIFENLGVKSIEDLKGACINKKLRHIEGLGIKIEQNILRSIEYLEKNKSKHLYPEALSDAERLIELLNSINGIKNCAYAGSLRRRKELIGDIDIVISCHDKLRLEVVSKFTSNEMVQSIIATGVTKSSIMLKSGIQCDLRIVNEKEYPFALNYFTGSKEHNVQLRSIARKKGWSLNEYGITNIRKNANSKNINKIPNCKSENDIYKALELHYIPPEIRENIGEIEYAKKHALPKFIEFKDIKGTFHCHSNYSDGFNTIEQMADSAIKLKWEYIGIADHSPAASYAGGLSINEFRDQIKEIDRLNERYSNFHIFKGVECDILSDGTLDFKDDILSLFDYVVASIHSKLNMTEVDATKRVIRALKNKYVTMLGHPTGRLLLEREGYPINMKEVIDVASDYGKAIELNSHPKRFDIDWRFLKYAKEKKVMIFINPDAHNIDGLKDVIYGVGIARKGWLEPKNVGNTLTLEKIKKYLQHL